MSSGRVAGRHLPRGLARMFQSLLDRVEASRLPRLQTAEIYGAVTVGGLIILLLLIRWLAG